MEKRIYTIIENKPTAARICRMELEADGAPEMNSGQFVEAAVPGKYLRRPISVSFSKPGRLTLLYKIAGEGTAILASLNPGAQLDILDGLGNGFDIKACRKNALIIGGGIGAAPLLQLCRDLREDGKDVTAILGFNTAGEIILGDELAALGANVHIATMDGSAGIRGLVTDVLCRIKPVFDYFYVCGPMPMMKALYSLLPGPGEFSLEERMGCGTGICFGCTIITKNGPRRICHDGPVFKKKELPW